MKKIFLLFGLFCSFALANENLKDLFKDYNESGVFIAYDGKNYYSNDFKKANKRILPASTFKIFNALIALNEGVVKDTNEIFYHYKGEKVFLPSWKNNANLALAMQRSQLPAYKELARKIGLEKMQKNLNKLNYGNQKISKIDEFWIDDSLQISLKEQATLLFKLANLTLDYPKHIQEEVINIIKLKENDHYELFAKTGWGLRQYGQIVGFIKSKKSDKISAFALNMNISDFNKLYLREEIVQLYLDQL
ncbi:TPA: OXA-493 family class D beta-lactamase [Campylobacter lari]|uniref:OXA-493 family class D beta-lactamase n=1 Tax=Campylobacter lari TaxID=201 RepID=UPI0012C43AB9|nr:OXA-493 family class D beta-lactamase [Campylobacter lari]EAI4484459.1 OXA-493 family class D beta-lactamase [Campylobacter lari]EAK9879320.1 OXA-493 family class D beta-lactamase [Campylobacter lari]EAK9880149.1 OXA-493 family class D beta-lactamase [Campylobacter lari]EAL0000880.1 OXA-493 family class D beta-lactamase [Campylobacter lari]